MRPRLVIAIWLCLGLGGPAAAAVSDRFSAGAWTGGSFARDDGHFSFCVLQRQDTKLTFEVFVEGLLTLDAIDARWALTNGAAYPVTLTIDGTLVHRVIGQARDANDITVRFDDPGRLLTDLRNGATMTVEVDGTSVGYAIKGLDAGLPRLYACAAAGMTGEGLQPIADPFQGDSNAAPAPSTSTIADGVPVRAQSPWPVPANPSVDWRVEFIAGNWHGKRVEGAGHVFTQCSIYATYGPDGLMFGAMPTGALMFAVEHEGWQLTNRQTYSAEVAVDDKAAIRMTATAMSAKHLFMTFVPSSPLPLDLRTGSKLTVSLEGEAPVAYALTGTGVAVPRVYACTAANLALEGRAASPSPFSAEVMAAATAPPKPPVQAARSNAPDDGSAPRVRAPRDATMPSAELAVLASNLLSEAGISGYHLMSRAELKAKHIDGFSVAWTTDDTFGALEGYDFRAARSNREEILTQVAAGIVSVDAQACHGKFASGFKDAESSKEVGLRRIFTACDDGKSNSWHYEYLLAVTPDQKLLKILTTAEVGENQGRLTTPTGGDPTELFAQVLRRRYAKPDSVLH